MRNVKNKPITYRDYYRMAELLYGREVAESIRVRAVFGLDAEVDDSEAVMINKIFDESKETI